MSDSLTSEPQSTFVCDCEEWMRSACEGEPFYNEYGGKRYCVLHLPGKEKSADFAKALQRKLENTDFNFRGVWFADRLSFPYFDFAGDVDFRSATFSADVDLSCATFRAKANFYKATFSAEANFGSAALSAEADFHNGTFSAEAKFYEATFSKSANFNSATFSNAPLFQAATFDAEAYLTSATFSAGAYFSSATFSAGVYFNSATFSAGAYFNSAIFSGDAKFIDCSLSGNADFSNVTFRDYVRFAGNERPVFDVTSYLDLQLARIEKPDHLSFHTLSLRPRWFVNVDARKFELLSETFIREDVEWGLN